VYFAIVFKLVVLPPAAEPRRTPSCARRPPIDILPDHPHEGEVIDETTIDLTRNFGPFDGYSNAEYPAPGGVQPAPEVIAWAPPFRSLSSSAAVMIWFEDPFACQTGGVEGGSDGDIWRVTTRCDVCLPTT
jgi:hypothetical protein